MYNSDENKPVRRNLRCPHCHHDDLAFVTEYHKALLCRSIRSVITFLMVLFLLLLFSSGLGEIGKILLQIFKFPTPEFETSLPGVIFFGVLRIGLTVYINDVESKTHIQAICRVCGNCWLLN